jgi:hypothetical protein
MYYVLTASVESRTKFQTTTATDAQDRSRIFVYVSPSFLASLYHGRTEIEGDRLFAPYRGKWMRVSGTVRNIENNIFGGKIVTLQAGPGGLLDRIFGTFVDTDVLAYFEPAWDERISVMRGGDRVTIIGIIESSGTLGGLDLQRCELQTTD